LIKEWDKKTQAVTDEKTQHHTQRLARVQEIASARSQQQSTASLELLREHLERLERADTKEASREELQTIQGEYDDAQATYTEKSKKVGRQVRRITEKVSTQMLDEVTKTTEEVEREFVETMGIKLYTSTDFRHFEAMETSI